jgi:hypothetical protein
MTDPNQLLWNHAVENEDWEEAAHLQELEAHERLGEVYLGYFNAHPEADWVIVGDSTEKVYGGGTDEQIPDEEAYEVFELAVGEKVHLFGKPVGVGLDGSIPT